MSRFGSINDPLMSSLMQEAAANINARARARAQKQHPSFFYLFYWNKHDQAWKPYTFGFATAAERDAKRVELKRIGISTAIRKGDA